MTWGFNMQMQSNITLVLTAVVIILTVLSGIHMIQLWVRPSTGMPKIGSRIRYQWIMTGVFFAAYLYSPRILVLYIWLQSFLALKEFLSITPTRQIDRRVLFAAYLSLPIQFIMILLGWYRGFIVFVPVYVFLVLPIIMVIIGETEGFLKEWSMLGWGILTTVFSMGYLAYLVMLPPLNGETGGGLGLFLFLVGLAQINHAAQYFFGKRFLDPRYRITVSQTRNWMSLVGSIVLTVPVAWVVAPLLTPFSRWEAVAISVIISAGAFIGYIILSAIKTDLKLADRGTVVPGRGGVLNRIDTFVYTAPLFFYIVTNFYYRSMLSANPGAF